MKLDFSQKYAVRPLTAGDVDKILALCAENEQFYRYHPPLATRESVLEDMTALPPGKCAADKHSLVFFDRETRVAVLAVIVQEGSSVQALNELLHQYGPYIIGRMGVPYRERGVNIISVALDAPNDVISALSGKLGRLDGITAKTVYAPDAAIRKEVAK